MPQLEWSRHHPPQRHPGKQVHTAHCEPLTGLYRIRGQGNKAPPVSGWRGRRGGCIFIKELRVAGSKISTLSRPVPSISHSAWEWKAAEGSRHCLTWGHWLRFPRRNKLECHSNSGAQLHLRNRITPDELKKAQYLVSPSISRPIFGYHIQCHLPGKQGHRDMGTRIHDTPVSQELKILWEEETNRKVTT